MDEIIDKLCEKFGVTADYLVSELAKQSITMDWIGIFLWVGLSVLVTIICVIFIDKIEDLLVFNSIASLIIVIPILIYLVTLIIIPCCVMDLISWHISPVASAIKYISNYF